MGAPTTVQQLVVIIVAVLPGVIYQFVRERARGRTSRDDNFAERVLRAIVAGVVLNAAYLIALGPWLTELVGAARLTPAAAVSARPREVALAALVLLIIVPGLAAWLVSFGQQRFRRTATQYRTTSTAWSYVFSRRQPCFVRVRLSDGTWVGGWYGTRSFASSHPGEGELYLESSYRMSADGTFLEKVATTGGVLVRADAVEVVEFVEPPPTPPPPDPPTNDGSTP